MDQKEIDRHWMTETIALAEKGAGRTSPNPMVGALIVKNGEVVGRGYHQRAGGPHAEPVALKEAGSQAAGATLYTNLEPCTHYGKTPPCVEAVADAGIATVVTAMVDPNPKINGAGVRYLRDHGIGVRVGVMRQTAMRQNEAHVKFVVTGRPLVVLKIAQTLDGKIAPTGGHGIELTGPAEKRDIAIEKAKGALCAFIDEAIARDIDAFMPSPMRLSFASFKDASVGTGIALLDAPEWAERTLALGWVVLWIAGFTCLGFQKRRASR